jgi:preprotein translocase subunit SecA
MLQLLTKLIGAPNERKIKKLDPIVYQINDLEPEWEKLSDEELRGKTVKFRNELANLKPTGDPKQDRKMELELLDILLPEAFATVREASRRTLGLRHFDVQLIGGMILHQGAIAEMRTGEGKTLVATLPAYLNALPGKGVHVVTVNDYLAKRDAEWMGAVYNFLGLTVGKVLSNDRGEDLFTNKRLAYAADITYGTNNEFGFDYLRDNMAATRHNLVQRPFYYAIVDEVDSILIDEARTPLIISGRLEKSAELYRTMSLLAPQLKPEDDYTIDEKARNIILTEEGIDKAQELLQVDDLFDPRTNLAHHLLQALKAKELYRRDIDYVVNDNGECVIVDEFTGRLMDGRRWSDGLHQAVEAKEGVTIQDETQTLASITFQNLFRLYPKLAGMTGTALTEEAEFGKIYNLEVTVIPTNRSDVRTDFSDSIYKNEPAKFRAVVQEIESLHKEGRPILVGTISIEKSEMISNLLAKRGIKHQVLNAKHHEREAYIVAQAGRKGAVTIATNMAGRGTDILLGGNPEFLAREELMRRGVDSLNVTREYLNEMIEKTREMTEKDRQDVVAVGGLHIIGTERHESRRIDNQLRGRAGRQGDPGSSRFYLALDDSLMRLFGGDRVASMMDMLNIEEDLPINAPMVSKAIEGAQRKVEAYHFDVRKSVIKYDDVLTQQRELIYKQRRQVLEGENLRESIVHMIGLEMDRQVSAHLVAELAPEDWEENALSEMLAELHSRIPQLTSTITQETLKGQKYPEIVVMVKTKTLDAYHNIEAELQQMAQKIETEYGVTFGSIEDAKREEDKHPLRLIERDILLQVIDSKWIDYLHNLDAMREGIGLRAYGQKDPLIEYKREAFDMFQQLTYDIQRETLNILFRTRIEIQLERQMEEQQHMEHEQDIETPLTEAIDHASFIHNEMSTLAPEPEPTLQPVRTAQTPGRNDPCYCGSGKKFKSCHGIAS